MSFSTHIIRLILYSVCREIYVIVPETICHSNSGTAHLIRKYGTSAGQSADKFNEQKNLAN